MASDFKFRPADICRSPMSEIFDFPKKFGLNNFVIYHLDLDHGHLQSLVFTDVLVILRNGLN